MTRLRNRRREHSALRNKAPEVALSGKLRDSIREHDEDENTGAESLESGATAAELLADRAHRQRASYRAAEEQAHRAEDTGREGTGSSLGRSTDRAGSGTGAGRYTEGSRAGAGAGNAGTAGTVYTGGSTKYDGGAASGSAQGMADGLGEELTAERAGGSNMLSRWRQRYDIKRQYAAARSGGAAGSGAGAGAGGAGSAGAEGAARESGSIFSKAADSAKEVGENAVQFVAEHWSILLIIGVVLILILMLSTVMTSCSSVGTGGGDVIVGTSYTAADDDVLGAEEDYIALEEALNQQIIEVRSQHPGYDEYRFDLDEIGHDPYQLAAILTILKEDYTREEVQELLQEILDLQYEIELTPSSETRHHSDENHTAYEWNILTIRLKNKGLDHVVEELGLDEDRLQRYEVIYELKGNRAYLFADDLYTNPGSTLEEYEIPGDALTDERFANMMAEAEKYIGVSYVWGGYSPSGFDCSGFVSYVINHCGNGWSYGHQTTWGLESITTRVSASEAQPGDLVFFQGTYNTTGPSHVGIYVGDGMMLHCGNPVHYSSIETSYWQEHLRGFGRLP